MNEIVIDGVIGGWDVDAKDIIDQLNSMSGDVTVKLNSVGGSVIEGISIFNAFKAYSKGKVTVEITAVAASIASYIALSADYIKAYDNAVYMIHNASLPVYGDYRELRKGADISEGLTSIIAKAYIAKTAIPETEIRALMEAETFYYGTEMVDAGFADEIIKTDTNSTKAEAMSLTLENIKACNNAIYEHKEEVDVEAVAQLLNIDKKEEKKEEKKVAGLEAKQRDIQIQIMEMEMKI